MRDPFATGDAAAVLADGNAPEFGRRYATHLGAWLAESAARAALADLVAAGVAADVAQRLVEAVRLEVQARLDPTPPIRQQPRLTLVHRRKPTS